MPSVLLLVAALLGAAGASRSSAAPTSAPATRAASGKMPEPAVPRAPAPSGEGEPASRDVAARARMLECGHQWSNMKRAGTASGTWKDFSRTCLAQR